MMKITIDREACIECGSCEATCPAVFKLPSGEKSTIVEKYRVNGLPESGEVPASLETCAQAAADLCPVTAISTQE
jgi:ferredoxin